MHPFRHARFLPAANQVQYSHEPESQMQQQNLSLPITQWQLVSQKNPEKNYSMLERVEHC